MLFRLKPLEVVAEIYFFFFLHYPLLREDWGGGSSSRLRRHTSRSFITSIILLVLNAKRFHLKSLMKLGHLILDRLTGLFLFSLTSKACLGCFPEAV